ncbi:hypothetical protein DL770_000627 [Monosporascus sp. CRB-9-2]|nr:hypothetical protein DL770_000627 [Monosporascus sp. CRB-9-2]
MLSPSEKEQTHLVTFGKRKTDIDGDPEGIWYRWAGNIAHPQHPRMGAVLEPIFSKLTTTAFTSSVELTCIAKMLDRIPKDDVKTIAKEESNDHGYRVIIENDEEVAVCFCLGGRKVPLMQAFDIDVDLPDSYGDSNRTKRCEARTAELVPEGRVPINVQQYLMAKMLKRDPLPHLSDWKMEGFFLNFQSSAQEQYWMQMSTDERQEWINEKKDKDYFHRWVRKIHLELDPERATVRGLPAAKMAVAHYGCWSMQTDPHANLIIRKADSRCAQIIRWQESAQPLAYLPAFQKAVLGKTTEIILFLLLSLDPGLYQEYCEVWDNAPEEQRVAFAGLCTFGDYTGGTMCIPQLGIKVPYRPGTCVLLRGSDMDHYVEDFSGPRFFTIGTHHDSCRQFAWRKLGRPEPAGKEKKRKEAAMRQKLPCINTGHDEDDLQWTNYELHGPGALPLNSSSSSASAGSAEN